MLMTNPVQKHRVCQIIQRLNLKPKEMRGVRAAFWTNRGISRLARRDSGHCPKTLRPFEKKGRSKLLYFMSSVCFTYTYIRNYFFASPLLRMTLAGFPTAMLMGSSGFTTTAPEPTTLPSPISAEYRMVTFMPM